MIAFLTSARIKMLGAVAILAVIGALYASLVTQNRRIDAMKVERAQLIADKALLIAAVKSLETNLAAKEQASIERQADTKAVDDMKEELHDAIRDIKPGTAPGAATLALGCERLRRAGKTGTYQYLSVCRRR